MSPRCSHFQDLLVTCALFCLVLAQSSMAFTSNCPRPTFASEAVFAPTRRTALQEAFSFQSEEKTDATEPAALADGNGKEFAVGSVVRIVSDSLKAFQIMPKGQGYFNENKEFVAGEKYLVLPVGLRGTVTKVYDVDEISANFPVQVKFTPGQHVDEGYDTPVPFLMHFETYEIECV